MGTNETNAASGQRGDAATCAPSPGPGCSALTSIESAVLNLNTAKRECWTGAEFLLSADVAEALICIDSALEQLQSAREKISASQNQSRQGAGHLVHGTLDGVVQPSESDLKK